jgi:hypothetical protein
LWALSHSPHWYFPMRPYRLRFTYATPLLITNSGCTSPPPGSGSRSPSSCRGAARLQLCAGAVRVGSQARVCPVSAQPGAIGPAHWASGVHLSCSLQQQQLQPPPPHVGGCAEDSTLVAVNGVNGVNWVNGVNGVNCAGVAPWHCGGASTSTGRAGGRGWRRGCSGGPGGIAGQQQGVHCAVAARLCVAPFKNCVSKSIHKKSLFIKKQLRGRGWPNPQTPALWPP